MLKISSELTLTDRVGKKFRSRPSLSETTKSQVALVAGLETLRQKRRIHATDKNKNLRV